MKIGFIGLGVMGAPMAMHLQKAGHHIVTAINRSPLPRALAEAGAEVLATPAEVAAICETVITMLPNTPDVERVLLGAGGVIEGVSPGRTIMDMSSISPTETKRFASIFKEAGCDYLDAPVSGGEIGAKAASLSIMVGGAASAFERTLPLLASMGQNITLIGEENGSGQICKIANQIIVALNIEAVSEALVFASKGGCDPETVRRALMGGFASSRVLEVHGQRMIERAFSPGFRMRLHQKDLNLALEAARDLGVSLPNTASTQQLFNSCAADGKIDDDHSGLIQALEKLAGHALA